MLNPKLLASCRLRKAQSIGRINLRIVESANGVGRKTMMVEREGKKEKAVVTFFVHYEIDG